MREAFQLSTEVEKGFENMQIGKKWFPGKKGQYEGNSMSGNGHLHWSLEQVIEEATEKLG